jgi:vitamin B12/bleomycin/antimicrobial peptide transport system ATP-binding/permease protein
MDHTQHGTQKGFWRGIATILRLSKPFFTSRARTTLPIPFMGGISVSERSLAWGLLITVLLINIGQVYISVLFNTWNGRFFTALSERQYDAFLRELWTFTWLAVVFIISAVYELYLSQLLQIRWREAMTRDWTQAWMRDGVPYRMQFSGNVPDNPDQRLSEDVRIFVSQTLSIGIKTFSTVLSLFAFVNILWGLSAAFPYSVFGFNLSVIPGYLVWFALLYALIGTWLTHAIGKPLIRLDFEKQKFEADFRFQLARTREYPEQIALLRGEDAERTLLSQRFESVVSNWIALMRRQKKLTWFTAGYNQLSDVVAFIMLAPAYFQSQMPFGNFTQASSAIARVQNGFSFFIDLYTTLADYRAVVDRLTTFKTRLDAAPQGFNVKKQEHIVLKSLVLQRVDGSVLAHVPDTTIQAGEHTIILGESGSGKSTLLRTLAGLWPFAQGEAFVPEHAFFLPQKPYVPEGSLRAALTYPAVPTLDAAETTVLKQHLTHLDLHRLHNHLDENALWQQTLSGGELQRVALIRAVLAQPQWLFLDEALSALDLENLKQSLPHTTFVAITHETDFERNMFQKKIILSN